jgi:CheY-like chemotaxis protein
MTGLLLDGRLDAEERECAETIRSSAESLLTIVNDILDFSKIEAGKMDLEMLDCDVRRLVDEVVDLLSESARRKGLTLGAVVAPELPALLRGDPGRLRQVLVNLVSNAIKFTERGEIEIRVASSETRVASAEDDHSHLAPRYSLRFSVCDTGIGISAEARDRLFQAFAQADGSTTRRYGGTGLGLAISRQLVELMGGQIGVESAPGVGSTFWFAIPFERSAVVPGPSRLMVAPGPRAAVPAAPARDAQPPADGKLRVLVVEDNPVNQRVAVRMLQRLGLGADVASDGLEAVESFSRQPYDLILMDCQMPGLDGYEATARIRQIEGTERHIPIVAMTASAMRGDRERCLEAGMDDYISKPVTIETLESVLGRWVPLPAHGDQGSRPRPLDVPVAPQPV